MQQFNHTVVQRFTTNICYLECKLQNLKQPLFLTNPKRNCAQGFISYADYTYFLPSVIIFYCMCVCCLRAFVYSGVFCIYYLYSGPWYHLQRREKLIKSTRRMCLPSQNSANFDVVWFYLEAMHSPSWIKYNMATQICVLIVFISENASYNCAKLGFLHSLILHYTMVGPPLEKKNKFCWRFMSRTNREMDCLQTCDKNYKPGPWYIITNEWIIYLLHICKEQRPFCNILYTPHGYDNCDLSLVNIQLCTLLVVWA